MLRRALFGPALLLALGVVAVQAACTEGTSSTPARDAGTNSGSSGDPPGSGGVTPGQGTPFVPPDSGPPPPNPNEGAVCEGVAITAGEIDQENLLENGAYFLTPSTGKPYQTFTVRKSGYLAGIELALQRARVGTGDTPGKIRLQVHSLPNTELMAAELPVMSVPKSQNVGGERNTLASGPPGPGYFAFGEGCVKLEAGVQYYWQAILVDVPKGVCTEGVCSVGRVGDPCEDATVAQDCDPMIRVSASPSGSTYDAGGWNNSQTSDIVFRTYMQPE